MNGLDAGTQAETMEEAAFPSLFSKPHSGFLYFSGAPTSHVMTFRKLCPFTESSVMKMLHRLPQRPMSSGEDTSFQVSSVCVKLAKQMNKPSSPLQQPPTRIEEVLLYQGVVAHPSKCTTGKAL